MEVMSWGRNAGNFDLRLQWRNCGATGGATMAQLVAQPECTLQGFGGSGLLPISSIRPFLFNCILRHPPTSPPCDATELQGLDMRLRISETFSRIRSLS